MNSISQDDLEMIHAQSNGYVGWLKLSSGRTVYIEAILRSSKEIGDSFKAILNRLKAE